MVARTLSANSNDGNIIPGFVPTTGGVSGIGGKVRDRTTKRSFFLSLICQDTPQTGPRQTLTPAIHNNVIVKTCCSWGHYSTMTSGMPPTSQINGTQPTTRLRAAVTTASASLPRRSRLSTIIRGSASHTYALSVCSCAVLCSCGCSAPIMCSDLLGVATLQ